VCIYWCRGWDDAQYFKKMQQNQQGQLIPIARTYQKKPLTLRKLIYLNTFGDHITHIPSPKHSIWTRPNFYFVCGAEGTAVLLHHNLHCYMRIGSSRHSVLLDFSGVPWGSPHDPPEPTAPRISNNHMLILCLANCQNMLTMTPILHTKSEVKFHLVSLLC
jgi:hypothetical protein